MTCFINIFQLPHEYWHVCVATLRNDKRLKNRYTLRRYLLKFFIQSGVKQYNILKGHIL